MNCSRPRALVSFLRPGDWIHFLALPFASLPASAGAGSVAAGLVSAGCLLAFAYGYNGFRDEHLDGGASEAVRERTGLAPAAFRLVLICLCLVGLLAAAKIGGSAPVAALVGIGGSWLYSGGPRLKRLPVVGTLANLSIFVPLLFLGGDAGRSELLYPVAVLFGLLLMQNQLIHELAHRERDRLEGIGTTAVSFGPAVVRRISSFLGMPGVAVMAGIAWHGRSLSAAAAAAILAVTSVLVLVPGLSEGECAASRLRLLHRLASLLCGLTVWLEMSG